MNRMLGVFFAVVAIVSTIATITTISFTLPWLLLATWTACLVWWVSKGPQKVEVGSKAELLFLGTRTGFILGEGWQWAPPLFGIKIADCREAVIKLDQLKIITAREDGSDVEISIDGSVIRKITDLHKYFDVDPSTIKDGLDDIWDEIIRSRIVNLSLNEALRVHVELKEQALEKMRERLPDWGITITKVIIAGIEVDEQVKRDLELKTREILKREGQKIELQNFADRVRELMKPEPDGPGFSREQAIEQVQLTIGSAAAKNIDAKTFTFDSSTAGIIASLLGRIK